MRSYRFIDWATQSYLATVALLIFVLRGDALGYWPWLLLAHISAMAAIHGLVRANASGKASPILRFLREFYPILLYTGFYRETELINALVGTPRLDPQLIRFEHQVFGYQPSVTFMNAAPQTWLSELLYAAYFSFYLMVAGTPLWLLLRQPNAFRRFVAVMSFVFYGCYFTYLFVPVIGPRLFFRDSPERALYGELYGGIVPLGFPDSVSSGPFFQIMRFIYRTFEAGSAAFPSSHVAVALTTLWFSWRYLRPIRWLHTVAAVLLCISTVYGRYHYVIDVVAGILTAAILVPTGNWLYERMDQRTEQPTNHAH